MTDDTYYRRLARENHHLREKIRDEEAWGWMWFLGGIMLVGFPIGAYLIQLFVFGG